MRQLESLVSYPPKKKAVSKPCSHSTVESRKLLQQYKDLAAASQKERQRFKMSSWASSAKSGATTSSLMLEQYEKAVQNGLSDEALSCLLEAVRLGENSADAFTNIGLLLQEKGQHADAIDNFTKSISRNPLVSESYLRRAECYMALDDSLSAVFEFEKFFKLENPPKLLLVKCGKCALDAGELEKSEFYLKQSLQIDPEDAVNHAWAYYNLGELEEKRQNDNQAKLFFSQVCESDPTFPDPYLAQAEEEFSLQNYPDALHLFEAVAKMLPSRADVYVRLADVFEQLGVEFTSSVLACLSKAVDLHTSDRTLFERTLVRRGQLLLANGSLDEAIGDFTVCLSANPVSASALLSRAMAFRNRGSSDDFAAAAEDYVTLVELKDVPWIDKAEPYRFLANAAFLETDLKVAAKYFGFAAAAGRIDAADEMRMFVAFAAACIEAGDSFEEQYEPRPWLLPREAEKGKKQTDLAKQTATGFPVPAAHYQMIDQFYLALRDREPTAHSGVEYQFIALWKPFRDEVEKKRDEAETQKGGKRGAKKK